MKKLLSLVLAAVMVLGLVPALASSAGPENVFASFANLEWSYASGAGAWSTDLQIHTDGSFTGDFHDSEMGETGEGYPDGTIYGCTFHGKLSVAEQVDEKTWRIHVDALTQDEGQVPEAIEDNVRYVTMAPAGLSEGDDMILYAPGTPVSALSEDMQLWAHIIDQETPPIELENWFLSSEKNDSGFLSYETVGLPNPWEEMTAEELKNASGLSFTVPEGAENVVFRYLRSEGLAEMLFTINGDEFCARVQPATEATNISGMYFAWENEEEVTVNGCTGTISQAQADASDWVELCQWFNAEQGRQYALSVCSTDLDGLDLTAVAEQIFAQ